MFSAVHEEKKESYPSPDPVSMGMAMNQTIRQNIFQQFMKEKRHFNVQNVQKSMAEKIP